jgi:hypothetical protein
MSYDDQRDILERLEALERLARSREDRGRRHDEHRGRRRHDRDRDGGRDHRDCGHDHHDCERDQRGDRDFDEKRIIDTIVSLVAEHVGRMLEEHQASAHRQNGGDEKRVVDLIVGLVSEHVQEIVARELDRRLGKRPLGESDAPQSSDAPESDQP